MIFRPTLGGRVVVLFEPVHEPVDDATRVLSALLREGFTFRSPCWITALTFSPLHRNPASQQQVSTKCGSALAWCENRVC